METKLNRCKMEKSIVYPQKRPKNNDKSSNRKAVRNHYLQVWGRDCTLVGAGGSNFSYSVLSVLKAACLLTPILKLRVIRVGMWEL